MLRHADLNTTQSTRAWRSGSFRRIHRAPHPAKLECDNHEMEEKLEAEESEDV